MENYKILVFSILIILCLNQFVIFIQQNNGDSSSANVPGHLRIKAEPGQAHQDPGSLGLIYTALAMLTAGIFWLIFSANKDPPCGTIYTQLPLKKEPGELWPPSSNWRDVTIEYSGLFFRALGSPNITTSLANEKHTSGAFGLSQEGSCPSLVKVESCTNLSPCSQAVSHASSANIFPNNNPSEGVFTSWSQSQCCYHNHGLKFTVSDDEVRPANIAIKLWEKIA
jgi:hypothetical protein